MSGDEKRVVAFAVDESHHSDDAFDYYVKNARKENDFLVLIHCCESYSLLDASPATIDQMIREEAEQVHKLQAKYKAMMEAAGIDGKFLAQKGRPGELVVSVAEEEGAQLIVMGTRGQGKLRRTILGSVSDYVIHHSSVPVLVCRMKKR